MFALAFVLATVPAPQEPAPGVLVPVHLRCEHNVAPLGIDQAQPVLSWQLRAVTEGARNLRQTAFQIAVASDAALLAAGRADLWDSGKVVGNATSDVVYAGVTLHSRQRCIWRVRAWDQDGKPGPWSGQSVWTMGLLDAADWQAQWIGHDAPLAARQTGPDLDGAAWLWADDAQGQPLQGEVHLRGTWQVPANLAAARLVISGDNQFELAINGAPAAKSDGNGDAWRRPVVVDAAKLLRPGKNELAVTVKNDGGPGGLIAKLVVDTGGEKAAFATDASWLLQGGATDDWRPARAVATYGTGPWGRIDTDATFLPPVRVLSTSFDAAQAPVRATLYASALGLYEVELGGEKVGDAFFAPGWTDYQKRVYYQTYDVTRAVRSGANALTVLLADGWYSGYVGYGKKRDHYGSRTRARIQLELEFADGTRQTVKSDATWMATTGELREADFLMGETCDRTFVPPAPVPVDVSPNDVPMQRHPGDPVRAFAELPARTVTKVGDDTYVCDLGQNLAGFARITMRDGKRGQRVVLRFAERLNPDGTVYTTNLRQARCIDTYVAAGEPVETWQPRFTFHGFQYVEVTGLGHAPAAGDVVGVAVSSDTPMTGDFECSEPMVNRLVSNIRWTQRMNFIDVPTDCPQRDERLGWTGDAQAYIRTATCLADAQAFYTKWLIDLADAQRADGQFPMVAPLKVAGDDGGPAWADAGTVCPWNVYDVYGDLRLLRRQYPSMVKFVEFCRARSTAELLPPKQFHCFGDWLHIDDPTPNEVIYEAYFAQSTRLCAMAAEVLGNADDAAKYEALWARVRAAFQRAFVAADGTVKGNSQTGYVLALAFDLLDEAQAAAAAQHLVAHIEGRKNHLSTGFVGTKDLMLVLDKIGRDDVAYRLLMNRTFPSWGFEIANGATSIWERWNGWTPEQGFNDPGMNSFAHYAFGAVGQWLFEVSAGIRTAGPGYRRIAIAPVPGGGLTFVKAHQYTVSGDVAVEWRVANGSIELAVTVPVNTIAVVRVPTDDAASVRIDGAEPKDVAGVRTVDGGLEIGSGRWRFTAKAR
ncbi:MAG: family 78 glycoside hydrolase catalytic domain [Planctomycetota bacterium]